MILGVRKGLHERQIFHALDGLRGIAALSVLYGHYSWMISQGHVSISLPRSFLAVDFFFILSGFVIAQAYEADLCAKMTMRQFLVRRLVRLYPLLLLGFLLTLLNLVLQSVLGLAHLQRSHWLLSLALSLLLLPTPSSLLPSTFRLFPLDGPAWSLSLEIFVNLFYAAVIRWLTARALSVFVICAGAILVLAAFKSGTLDIGVSWDNYYGGFLRVGWGFFAGVGLYRLWSNHPLAKLRGRVFLALSVFFICLAAMSTPSGLLDAVCAIVIFPAMVYTGAAIELTGVGLSFAKRLGQLSYAIYIVHVPISEFVKTIGLWCGINLVSLGTPGVVGCAAFVIVSAAAFDVFYDRPIRAFLNRRFVNRPGIARSPRVAIGSGVDVST